MVINTCRKIVSFVFWMTTFAGAIGHVVFLGSYEQMIRIHTRRNIALVTHEQASRDWALKEFPRKPMTEFWNMLESFCKNPVSVLVFAPRPKPT